MDLKETIQKTQAEILQTLNRISAMDEKARQDHAKARQEMAEIRASHKKASQEMADLRASMAASHKKASQEMAEIRAENRARDKRTEREFKKTKELFIGQWGMLVESLVEGDLIKQLKKRNISVYGVSPRIHGRMHTTDSQGRRQEKLCEIDLIAKNGKEIVAVEVKTSLKTKDVDKFLGILKYFTQYLPEYKDNIVYGAVAYLKVQRGAELYAEKKGLFVIKATGDSSSIVNRPNFKPKVFG